MKAVGVVILVAANLSWIGEAVADCTEPPQPGVDWRRCTMHSREFIDSDLSGARLKDGRFTRANFSGSDLSKVDARRAKFIDAIAKKTNFEGARLAGADFTKADVSNANFKDADLYKVQFQGTVMRGADLTDANIARTNMTGADLSGVRWVDGETICAEGSIGQCIRGSGTTGASG